MVFNASKQPEHRHGATIFDVVFCDLERIPGNVRLHPWLWFHKRSACMFLNQLS